MLYRIASTSCYRDERLIEDYPCLKDFGWKLTEYTRTQRTRIFDENNKAIYQEIPKTLYKPYIEINTLEELQKLKAAVQNPLIFMEDEIEIYDDYRE